EAALSAQANHGTGAGGHPALSLRLANVALPSSWEPERDRLDVDLMPGLPADNSGADLALTIATALPGIVTVYAPNIEYRPPD
ncbi:MAG: hypothetical protein WBA99_09475, partial [Nodosilinea sp.]